MGGKGEGSKGKGGLTIGMLGNGLDVLFYFLNDDINSLFALCGW